MAKRRRKTIFVVSGFLLLAIGIGIVAGLFSVRKVVRESFGRPAPTLTLIQRILYPFELFIHRDDLTTARENGGGEQVFVVESGESISMVCLRLENAGLIQDSELLRTYLVYSGLDRHLQSGQFRLSPEMSSVQIASELLDATPKEAIVTILPGWRMEEVAASVAGSGLSISSDAFIYSVNNPSEELLSLLPVNEIPNIEGFLFPETYVFPREAGLQEVLRAILSEFSSKIDQALIDGFSRQGLTIYDAITLASIVEKEAVVDEEKPMIASVFYNRLAAGMRLETDPTVQYALGYQDERGTWWKAPLALKDLEVESPYNTYLIFGLPPTPICNPGLDSLRAVAFPAETPYFYFRAACDGTGRHLFAITFEEHLNNACE
ncbi:MAG: endolytic transglycosylase MltG [Brevefilum sp.]